MGFLPVYQEYFGN